MLSELNIKNFAIIDQVALQLGAGLITFTGETGAGKSIIIDAVETLIGGRADSSMVRSGADYAYIEGVFLLSPTENSVLREILEREELLDEITKELTITREIKSSGRSIARFNGRTINASLLREIGEFLVDIHGQSEHLSLLRVSQHLGLLDGYANTASLLEAYRKTYRSIIKVRSDLKQLHEAERDAARRLDTFNYQVNEIESAQLKPGEEETLKEERTRLVNAEGISAYSQQALQALDEGTPESMAVTDQFGQVVHALQSLARLDAAKSQLVEQAALVFEQIEDLSRELRRYLETIEFNPRRLDQIEDRLNLIHNLKRKYGETVPAVIEYASKARQEMDAINHAGERIEELVSQERDLLSRLAQQGIELSEQRHHSAIKLSSSVENELRDLQMEGTLFKVEFERRADPQGITLQDGQRVAFDANGFERVEFFIAPNLGEGFKPLVKIASGGETSRLMLALKNVLVSADKVPTLIFDEIDQGIGGRVGGVVGQKLWHLSHRHQVLCVTHLPQLAVYGQHHYHVGKSIFEGRTTTRVKLLDGQDRIQELAQMLGGSGAAMHESARETLKEAGQYILSHKRG